MDQFSVSRLFTRMRDRMWFGVKVLPLLVLAALGVANAQVLTGQIDGTVHDPSGALIAGASVTIVNSDQNVRSRMLTTDSKGQFTAPLLAVGTYRVIIESGGFKKEEVTSIDVHVGQPSSLVVTLTAGGVTEEVTVSASTVSPQLDSAAAGTLISHEQATELPLSSRNYLQLLTIQPGITGNIPGRNERGNVSASGAVNTQTFSVNGNPVNGNGYYLDGADTLKRAGQQPVTFPGVDFIQEINLQRASYGAEFGGPGASVTSVQTKAGTTDFHGGFFYFFRSQVLNANTYFNKLAGLPRGGERYNNYGYYIGGPVWLPKLWPRKDPRTFFFFGQEYLRSETAILQNVSNIPTAAQRTGMFATPVCTVATNPCPANARTTMITASDPTVKAYLTDVISNVPLPNNPLDVQGLIYNSPGTNNESQTIIRIDHRVNSKLSLFMRYLDDPFNLVVPNGFQQTSQIPGIATSKITNGSTSWLGHATWILSSRNVIEGGYSYRANWLTAHSIGLMARVNAPDVNVNLPYVNNLDHIPQLRIGSSTYNVTGAYDERSPVQQIFVNSTNTYGRNTIKVGGNFEIEHSGGTQGVANAGNIGITAVATPTALGTSAFAQAFAQFLQARISTFAQANVDVGSSATLNIYEGYGQDDLKVTPKLTILFGMRYSYFAAGNAEAFPGRSLLPVLNFLPAAFNIANVPTLDSAGALCNTSPCAGGAIPNPNASVTNGIIIGGINSPFGQTVAQAPRDSIAPRFGFTYDVFGNGLTSLRGGYGIYYFSQVGNPTKLATNQDPPNVLTLNTSNSTFANPAGGTVVAQPQNLQAYTAQGRQSYSESFNVDVQQQIRPGMVLDLGYYGNRGLHLASDIDLNQPVAGAYVGRTSIPAGGVTAANTPTLNLVRPYHGYAAITYNSQQFISKYNGLQVSLRQQYGKVLVTTNYTWSKALTNSRTPQDNSNLAVEYGATGNDRRSVFNASFVYPLPFFARKAKLLGRIAGGFQFSGIVAYGSGQWSTATTGTVDPAGLALLVGPATPRPDQVGDPNQTAPRTFQQWFNKNAFQNVPAGVVREGNAHVQNILGPGYGVWNLTLSKDTHFSEKVYLQLRAEAYNIWNQTNFNAINTNITATNYGQVTSTGDPRTMQLGAKLLF